MFAIPVTRESHPVGVLLGGSGRARMPSMRIPILPALLRPLPAIPGWYGSASEYHAARV